MFTNTELKKMMDKEENLSLIKDSQKSVVLGKFIIKSREKIPQTVVFIQEILYYFEQTNERNRFLRRVS